MTKLSMSVLAGFVAALMAANPAEAQQLTTGELMEFCGSGDAASKAACRLFIYGVVQGVDAADGTTFKGDQFVPGKKTIMCVPRNVSDKTLEERFQTMARGVTELFPEGASEPAVSTVVAAMAKIYPCK
jgi:hypothetical protein